MSLKSANVFQYGTPYGIQTHDLRRERAMSLVARRTVQKTKIQIFKEHLLQKELYTN